MTSDKSVIRYDHRDNVINLSGIRRQNAPYLVVWVLYYAWVVAYATWWTASPISDSVSDAQLRSLMHAVNLLSSAAFVLIIRRQKFVTTARIFAVLIVLCMAAYYLIPSDPTSAAAAVLGSVAIGCFNISILIPFVFMLNNTEKLYAVVSSNLLIQLISLLNEQSIPDLAEPVISFVLLLFSLGAVLFFRKKAEKTEPIAENIIKPAINRRVYLSLLFNCAIAILCKGAGKGILNITAANFGSTVITGYYLGGLAGCILYVLMYAFTKKAYIWLGNVTFSTITIALLCNAFIRQAPELAVPFSVLLGVGTTVGMINMYYIIGVIGKKYDSMRYVRISILSVGLFGGITGILVGNWIDRAGTYEISVSASVLAAVVMLAFMFVSPVMERADYVNDWGLDSGRKEVGGGYTALFRVYGLSKREAEVCELLLQGFTLRQISAILPISYSTVNTYCTSAYRKLHINSRTELVIKFKDYLLK